MCHKLARRLPFGLPAIPRAAAGPRCWVVLDGPRRPVNVGVATWAGTSAQHDSSLDLNKGNHMLRTPMHVAASHGCIEALSWLVAQPSVDVNAVVCSTAAPLQPQCCCSALSQQRLPRPHAASRLEGLCASIARPCGPPLRMADQSDAPGQKVSMTKRFLQQAGS